jgi:uncharacterized membrane protein YgcG
MRLLRVIALCLICCVAVGCKKKEVEYPIVDKGAINRGLISSYSDMAMQNAIVSQRTLYPYHFKTALADLNGLGRRDLAVLAEHFGQSPWDLNIRRATESLEIYQARVEQAKQTLTELGLDPARITIADGLPGGRGMQTERMLTIQSAAEEASGSQLSGGSGTSSSGAGSSTSSSGSSGSSGGS